MKFCFSLVLVVFEIQKFLCLFYSETDNLLTKQPSTTTDEVDSNNISKSDEHKKMSNSKEMSKQKAELEAQIVEGSGGILSIIYSAAKKVAMVGAVYFLGYMNWSVS
jgi:sortase (surface protein transpeptidase)